VVDRLYTFDDPQLFVTAHPLVPGDSSAVEKGPWHYGADYVAVYFSASPTSLLHLVPPPFEVGDGTCIAYVCEIVSVAEDGQAALLRMPDRAVYHEAAVGVKCSYKGRPGIFFPVMWVDTEWALLRGILNGYPKRLADKVAVSRVHPLNPGQKPLGAGVGLSGYCMKGPDEALSVKVELMKRGEPKDLLGFGATYGMRQFPQTDPSQGYVAEAVEVSKSNSRTADVWLGKGTFATNLDIGETVVLGGAVYRSGFTINGAKVLQKM
jgi:Acetoacetate decarboxylase (ADC)